MLNLPARFGETNNVCRDSVEESNPHDDVTLVAGRRVYVERAKLKAVEQSVTCNTATTHIHYFQHNQCCMAFITHLKSRQIILRRSRIEDVQINHGCVRAQLANGCTYHVAEASTHTHTRSKNARLVHFHFALCVDVGEAQSRQDRSGSGSNSQLPAETRGSGTPGLTAARLASPSAGSPLRFPPPIVLRMCA